MSFVITLYVREGIVMASDSRLTLNTARRQKERQEFFKIIVSPAKALIERELNEQSSNEVSPPSQKKEIVDTNETEPEDDDTEEAVDTTETESEEDYEEADESSPDTTYNETDESDEDDKDGM